MYTPRSPKLIALVVFAAVISALLFSACSSPEPTPTPGISIPAPTWEMQSHNGETLNSDDLKGKAYVVNFTWTNCKDTCPTLSLQMALLQDRLIEEGLLGESVKMVSISFDHERDTPDRLNEYAQLFGAKDGEWHFLTGSPEELERVITRGFGVSYRPFTPDHGGASGLREELAPPLEVNVDDPTLSDYLGADSVSDFLEIDGSVDFDHQNVFVLVDAEGNIRQYYLTVFLDRDEVIADILALSS